MPILLIVFLLILATPLQANQTVTMSRLVSVYDADTFRVDISGWPSIVGENMPVRVLGVDAPEIRGKCPQEKTQARAAKAFTLQALEAAEVVELRNLKRGKYFRFLADVYIHGENLAAMLIEQGHGRPYDGGTRQGWCPS